MDITLNRECSVPLYVQIRDHIRGMIFAGALPGGYRLPPERKLAEELGVNRTTVLTAYRDLKAEGLVDAHVGRGTRILELDGSNPETMDREPMHWERFMRSFSVEDDDPLMREISELQSLRDTISFCRGLPDPALIPVDLLREIADELMAEDLQALFRLAPREGLPSLREGVARIMEMRGCRVSVDELTIVSGSQQGIDLVSRVFIEPGDTVVVDDPTYRHALYLFRMQGARTLPVPVEADGIRLDVLEGILRRYTPKFIYLNPTFHNPTGSVLPVAKRRKLLEIVGRYGIPIVEDDPVFDLRFEGDAVPPIKALDQNAQTIYISSASKTIAPGVRIGWIAAPKPVTQRLVAVKRLSDLAGSTFCQAMVARFLEKGLYPDQLRKLRAVCRAKRDMMLEALRPAAAHGVTWEIPRGGMSVWAKLPLWVSPPRLLSKVVDRDVVYSPGNIFSANGHHQHYIRFNFTIPSGEEIARGIGSFVRVLEGYEKNCLLRRERSKEESCCPIV